MDGSFNKALKELGKIIFLPVSFSYFEARNFMILSYSSSFYFVDIILLNLNKLL
jgi:hypothetical protein